MEKSKKVLLAAGIVIVILLVTIPAVAYAQNWNINEYIPTEIRNVTIQTLITNIIRILLIVAGIVALIYMIVGGYQYMTAGGNAEQAAAARTTILNAIIGVIIVFASYAIITWFMGTFIGTTPSPTPTPTPGP